MVPACRSAHCRLIPDPARAISQAHRQHALPYRAGHARAAFRAAAHRSGMPTPYCLQNLQQGGPLWGGFSFQVVLALHFGAEVNIDQEQTQALFWFNCKKSPDVSVRG